MSMTISKSMLTMKRILLWVLVLGLSACAVQRVPTDISDAELIESESSLLTGVAAADNLLRQGEEARRAGDYANSANNLERGIRMAPRSPSLYLALAKTRLAMGQYGSATQMAQRAVSLLPATPRGAEQTAKAEAWIVIAQAREKQGDISGAERARAQAQAVW